MNNQNAEHPLIRDIDDLLTGNSTLGDGDCQEHHELLALAQSLAGLDFCLIDQAGPRLRQKMDLLIETPRFSLAKVSRWAGSSLGWVKVAAAALLCLSLVFHGSLSAMADDLALGITKLLRLGNHLVVMQVEPVQPADPGEEDQTTASWEVSCEVAANSDGEVVVKSRNASPSGQESGRVVFPDLARAREEVCFAVLSPQYLPEGYSLEKVLGYEGPDQYLDLFFSGPGEEIILMQRIMTGDTGFGFASDSPVEEVDINGVQGAWIEPHTLIWESKGVGYGLYTKGFSQEEALRIARSLK